MNEPRHDDQRLLELLADEAVGQLDDAGRRRLDALLAGRTDESMRLAAAAATIAMLGPHPEAMPPSLRARVASAVPPGAAGSAPSDGATS